MIALKVLLIVAGSLMLASAIGIPLYSLWLRVKEARNKPDEAEASGPTIIEFDPIPWRDAILFAASGCAALILATGIVVVPSGVGGVRISQISGTLPGTLYPGAHFLTPLVDSVQVFDLRDHLFSAGVSDDGMKKAGAKPALLMVQSKEGLNIGMGVTVRYRLDPNQLASVQSHLTQPKDKQIVPPVVDSAWRELAPQYTVKEIFSTKREEVRSRAAGIIARKLAPDGIVVEEVMLSDIRLPEEYAKGMEALLVKEQQDDEMTVDTEIQQKQVRIAELQAEAEAKQKVEQAEGEAQARVVEARGESDAMQYTLPFKQKQIEQSKLEAEARKKMPATWHRPRALAFAKVSFSLIRCRRDHCRHGPDALWCS